MSPVARGQLDSIQVQVEQPTADDDLGRVTVKSTSSVVVLDISINRGPLGGRSVEAYSYEAGHKVRCGQADFPTAIVATFFDDGVPEADER